MTRSRSLKIGLLLTGATVGSSTLLFGGFRPKENAKEAVEKLSQEDIDKVKEFEFPEECYNKGQQCTLSQESLKKINFSNGTDSNLKITSSPQVKLTLEKVTATNEKTLFPDGLKFNIQSTTDLNIGSDKITLKANTNYEFKKNSGGQLEKVWKNREEVAKKVGFKDGCTEISTSSFKACALSSQKPNIYKDGQKYKSLEPETTSKSKNISLENNETAGFNNGFKFSSPEELKFKKPNNEEGETITISKGKEFEVKFMEDDWYLIVK